MTVVYGTHFNGGLEKRLPISLRRKLRTHRGYVTPAYKAQRAKWKHARPLRPSMTLQQAESLLKVGLANPDELAP